MADRVYMQSPQGEIKEVEATAEALSPLMAAGFHQVPSIAGLLQEPKPVNVPQRFRAGRPKQQARGLCHPSDFENMRSAFQIGGTGVAPVKSGVPPDFVMSRTIRVGGR